MLMRHTFIALFLLTACSSQSDGPPAGLAAYACHAGQAHVLLAFDPHPARRAWSTLGGGAQADETPAQTALREFREESNCAYTAEELASIELSGPSVSAGVPFHLYAAKVPFKPISEFDQERSCVDIERSQWVWVKHADLVQALNNKAMTVPVALGPLPQVALWNRGVESLRKAMEDGVLPDNPNTIDCLGTAP